MDIYIKDIVIRKCDTDSKIKALSDLENDIAIAKGIITGKYIYCNDCDDYYLAGSFMEEKEYKDEKILFAAQMIMNFFPDEPCNYNGMDEHTLCDYCEEHCGDHDTFDCWAHAIENRWYMSRRVKND